jgi:IclR family transcriptional regulator, acetate operon repressor
MVEQRRTEPQPVQSVARAAALLMAFVDEPDGLRLKDLARRTNLNTATAYRLLTTLRQSGLVARKGGDDIRYVLGPSVVSLYRSAYASGGFDEALHVLQGLVDATGESAAFSIRDGNDIVVVLRVASPHPLRVVEPSGGRAPIHTSAVGRALLALSPDLSATVQQLVPLHADTPLTETNPASFLAELHRIREQGFAIITEEQYLGMRSIGVAVQSNAVVGGVATIGPLARMTDERRTDLIAQTRSAADHIAALVDEGLLTATPQILT